MREDSTSGRFPPAVERVTELAAQVVDGALVFTADVACAADHGAILSYEIAPQ